MHVATTLPLRRAGISSSSSRL